MIHSYSKANGNYQAIELIQDQALITIKNMPQDPFTAVDWLCDNLSSVTDTNYNKIIDMFASSTTTSAYVNQTHSSNVVLNCISKLESTQDL